MLQGRSSRPTSDTVNCPSGSACYGEERNESFRGWRLGHVAQWMILLCSAGPRMATAVERPTLQDSSAALIRINDARLRQNTMHRYVKR
jgi:hypothetical protein